MYPSELKYSKSHEWLRIEGDQAKMGITSYAIEELTDLTYIQFDVEVGDTVSKGNAFGVIESVKATSDLYTQVSGEVVAINEEMVDAVEELVNDPYQNGWMIEVKLSDLAEANELMSVEQYETFCQEQEH